MYLLYIYVYFSFSSLKKNLFALLPRRILGLMRGLRRRPETHFGMNARFVAEWWKRGGGKMWGDGPQWHVMPQHGGNTYHYKHTDSAGDFPRPPPPAPRLPVPPRLPPPAPRSPLALWVRTLRAMLPIKHNSFLIINWHLIVQNIVG